jgi:quinoprotein glucose dehydrogenase
MPSNDRRRFFKSSLAGLVIGGLSLSISGQTPAPKEWRDYAGGPDGSRFMALDEITKANVDKLEVAWTYPYAQTGYNPIVAHGTIYTKGRNGSLIAIDAATGKEIWIHDGLQGSTERGMNYWESADGNDRRLLFTVSDYLQEIDAKTGKSIPSFGIDGAVDLRDGLGRDPKTIHVQSGTPGKVFENLILLGSAPGEGYFSAPGDLRAYNVITGKLAWQFHTLPHPGELGYDTWPKDAWRYGGAANTWGEISVDAVRGIAYFPTGSPVFDYYGADRVGQDLFGNCLIALDARTGKRLWHFQNVHHDLWDFDNVAAPQLTTVTHNGQKVDVVALAGKTGYLYVFNRVTGEPIWPIEEKPVSTKTDVPGEVLSPTQPIPTAPPPFGRLTFTVNDINPYMLSDAERAAFKERVEKARNDGLFTPIGFSEVIHMPGNHGGANWGSTSANPGDGSVYVIAFNVPAIMRLMRPGEQPPARGGGAGAIAGPGQAIYAANCQACHGPDRAGQASVPSLVGVSTRLTAAQIRTMVFEGKGQMPAFHQLSAENMDALVSFLTAADAMGRGGRGGAGGFGRGRGAAETFPPGPIVQTGPVMTRPGEVPGQRGGGAPAAPQSYPEGVPAPANQLTMESYGLHPTLINPPYTTLTAYDLNKGTIKWRIGLGDDFRVASQNVKGTGAAETLKGSVIPTSTGLLFVNAADRKIHVYDSDTGKQITELKVGASTSGSPSMYELNGRQYLLVTSSPVGTRIGNEGAAADPAQTGPTGLIAYALKK